MTRERLTALMDKFQGLRIAVMGDLFLDRWLTIDPKLDEPSVETGLAAWQVTDSRCYAGAAGTVLNNLSELGVGEIYAISMLGKDGEGFEVKRALQARGVDLNLLLESEQVTTPAYVKPLFMQADGSLVEGNRMDHKNRKQTPADLEKTLLNNLECAAECVDAIVFLDQLNEENTGVLTNAVREAIARLGREKPSLLLYADSRAFIGSYHDVMIKCNNFEAAALAGLPCGEHFDKSEAFAALDALAKQTDRQVFVTCNAHGVAVREQGESILVPAARQDGPIDVCGAGDGCTAGIISALCAGATPTEAALMGNLCAGVTVRKLGTTGTASQKEVLALYDEQFGGGMNG